MAGEPPEYATGRLRFRGLDFKMDRRAYVTDPELSFLVEQVARCGADLAARMQRPAVLVEVGLGCASLALSLKTELRERARVIGLEIDPAALELARENIVAHGLEVEALQSDLFSAIEHAVVPDVVYGDPPWGDHSTLYDIERDEGYYRAMPALSAFPEGGKVGLHERILRKLALHAWGAQMFLNVGVLSNADLAPLFALAPHATLARGGPGQCVLQCVL